MATCSQNTEHVIDKASKALSVGVTRRDAMKWVGAGVLGTMLTAVGVRRAEAGKFSCTSFGSACDTPSTGQCICGAKLKNPSKGLCCDNFFCSTPANHNCDPATGGTPCAKPYKCIHVTGCSGTFVCQTKCNKVPCCTAQSTGGTNAG